MNSLSRVCRITGILSHCRDKLIIKMSNLNATLRSFRCPICNIFFNRISNLERHWTTCSEQLINVDPKIVYQTQETLFDKLDSFVIKQANEQKHFKNLASFDFKPPLSARRKLQRHRYNKVDYKACCHLGFLFPKPCQRISFPLQLWSSSSCYFFNPCPWTLNFPKQSNIGRSVS